MSNSKERFILGVSIFAAAFLIKKKRKAKRKTWARQWLLRRKTLGCYENLMRELALEDTEGYRRWLRMDTATFEEILSLVSPIISKQDTQMRLSIPAGERLSLTLRFLATGETQSSLAYQFRIAQNTISGILPAVCKALYDVLKAEYMDTPTSNKHWEEIATDFYLKWNFPMCFGALDGKHIKIKPPPGSGSMYYNYKGDFSIVLLALVDANLKFIYVDVGTNGRISDGGVWDKSKLKSLVERDELFLPAPNTLPGTDVNVPYVIVADDAFPLTQYIMKPYPGRHLTKEKRIFNYRLSRARRIVENAFGILAARFRLFGTTILTSPQKAQYFVLAACCLHNLLRSKKETTNLYTPEHSLDAEDFENNRIRKGTWNESTSKFISLQRSARNGSQEAKDVRDRFCNYFNGIGSIPWQEAMCDLH